MKRALLTLIISSLLLVITGCGVVKAQEVNSNNLQKSNYNFVFKYGVTARNTLDTSQGTFTKDMVSAPGVTIDLVLTADEMDSIYKKMMEIDFFNYPDEFKVTPEGDLVGMVTPYSTYYFKVDYGSGIKELIWEDEITNSNEQADKLRELINLIKNIIESKAEYQALPEPSGGYM
jgi:hypothetical protein